MITIEEVLILIQPLQVKDLERWIEQDWVRPERHEGEYRFAEIDVARIQLINDIHDTLEIASQTTPIVLSLIDQLYTTRRQLRTVLNAVDSLPPETRGLVLSSLGDTAKHRSTESLKRRPGP